MRSLTANAHNPGKGHMKKTLPNRHPKKSAAQGSTQAAETQIRGGPDPVPYADADG